MLYKPLQRNVLVMYFMTGATSFAFFYPVLALYLQEQLVTVQNVTLIYAIMTIGTAILEVPTGVFADLVGRRITLILAACVDLLAVALLAVGTSFVHFTFYAIAVSITAALTSGASNAFLYDTLTSLERKNDYQKVLGRIGMISALAAGTASVIGGLLAMYSLRATAVWTLVPCALGAAASLFLHEPPKELAGERPLRHALSSLTFLLSHRTLLAIIIATILFDVGAEPIYQLSQIFYETNGVPLAAFGVLYLLGMVLRSGGSWIAHHVTARLGNVMTVALGLVATVMSVMTATLIGGWSAVAVFLVMYGLFGFLHPVLSDMTNTHIASGQRATVLSIINLASSVGLTLAVPFIGALADDIGIRAAYRVFAILLLPAAFLIALQRERRL